MSLVVEQSINELRNKSNEGFFYLASPYSHEDHRVVLAES